MVPGEGVEPSLPRGNWILNPARLPIPPSGHREKVDFIVDYFGFGNLGVLDRLDF